MKTQEIYELAVKMGQETDFRSAEAIQKLLARKKEKFEKLSVEEKADFDKESLINPYSDTRILYIAQDKPIKKTLVGIDIEPAEILIAKELGGIDLIISHHPLGSAFANLHEVMDLQCDILSQYGVPINVAEGLTREKISEVARGVSARNHQQPVDAAKLLGFNLMCVHTAADNLAAKFLAEKVSGQPMERIEDLMKLLKTIPEYQIAAKQGAGPKIFVGNPDSHCGKIAIT